MSLPQWAKPRKLVGSRAFVSLVDQGAVSAANFATGILLSRAFIGQRREQLGLYYLAFTISILITELQNALVSTPHMVSAPKLRGGDLNRFNGSALIHHIVLSAAITVVLLLIALAAPFAGLTSHQPMLFACAITAGAVGLRNFVRFLNFTLHRPHITCIADCVVAVLQIAGILTLAKMGRLSAAAAVAMIGLACLVGGLLALALSLKHLRPHPGQAWADFRDNWRLSRWICASGIVWNVGTALYPWLIDTFSGALPVAVYGNCNAVSSFLNPMLMGLQNWAAPAVAHAYADRSLARFRSLVLRLASLFLMAMPPMLLALGLISNPLLHHVYHDWTPGTLLLVLLLLAGSIIQSASFVISRGLFSLGRGDLDLWANFVPIAVLLAAGYFLIHHYGATGAAACLLVALVLSTAVRTILFLKVTAARRTASQPAVNAMEGIVPAEAM